MATTRPSVEDVWIWLDAVPDPEIPAISLVDLGIIRDVAWEGEALAVTVTPTYSGCPATTAINLDIVRALNAKGIGRVVLRRQLSPAWTTAWISAKGRETLHACGIAPPREGEAGPPPCPRCGSVATSRVSQFGSTPCKATWRCRDCLEPFDHFKCH